MSRSLSRITRVFGIASLAFMLSTTGARGQGGNTWDGGLGPGNPNWFSAGTTASDNWVSSGSPLNVYLFFPSNVNNSYAPNQNGNFQAHGILFNAGSPSYTLGSTTSSTLRVVDRIENYSSALQTITNVVEFSNSNYTLQTINTQSGPITLSTLTGTAFIDKSGTGGVLTLGDASTFSGTMQISSGTVLNTGNFFGDSIVNNGGVFSGGTVAGTFVQTAGTGSFGSALSVNQTGGTIAFSTGSITQSSTLNAVNSISGSFGSTVTFGGALVLGSTNRLTLDVAAGGVADKVVVNGLLTYGGSLSISFTESGTLANGTTWSLFDPLGGVSGSFAGIGGSGVGPYAGLAWTPATLSTSTFDQSYGPGVWLTDWTAGNQRLVFNQATGDITVVPEPSTFVMAAAGIAGFALVRYRRRRRLLAGPEGDRAEGSSEPS